jgi:hypothetical protein
MWIDKGRLLSTTLCGCLLASPVVALRATAQTTAEGEWTWMGEPHRQHLKVSTAPLASLLLSITPAPEARR